MRMQLATGMFERTRGDLPFLPLYNMVVEQAPTEETQFALQSRPPLNDRAENVSTTVDALFRRDGVVSGKLVGISGTSLYADGVLVGSISGTGAVSVAGNELGVMVTRGSGLWYYNGTTIAAVTFPDTANVVKVFTGASRFWAIRKDTGKIYWTPSLDVTVDGLDFATAESVPDKLLDGLWIDDVAVLFGAESIEFWPNTGDATAPIQPLEGRVFSKGIKATGCATQWGETFAWVGSDNMVYANGDQPQPLSFPGMVALIEASTACSLWSFTWEGQDFLALRIDNRTFVYGNRNSKWSEFKSYGSDNWLAQCWVDGVFGCSNGKTATFGTGLDLGQPMERRFAGGFAVNSGGVTVSNLTLRGNTGQTTYLSGDYADPTLEMRTSRNGGKTWGEWKSRSLGIQGNYGKRVQWRGLGMVSQPGILAEWRLVAPVDYRVSDCLVNEQWGGRS